MYYGASATGGPPQGSGICFFAAGGWATRREPNMRQDPVRQKPGLYFSQARQKGYLIDRNARLLGESGPGREWLATNARISAGVVARGSPPMLSSLPFTSGTEMARRTSALSL